MARLTDEQMAALEAQLGRYTSSSGGPQLSENFRHFFKERRRRNWTNLGLGLAGVFTGAGGLVREFRNQFDRPGQQIDPKLLEILSESETKARETLMKTYKSPEDRALETFKIRAGMFADVIDGMAGGGSNAASILRTTVPKKSELILKTVMGEKGFDPVLKDRTLVNAANMSHRFNQPAGMNDTDLNDLVTLLNDYPDEGPRSYYGKMLIDEIGAGMSSVGGGPELIEAVRARNPQVADRMFSLYQGGTQESEAYFSALNEAGKAAVRQLDEDAYDAANSVRVGANSAVSAWNAITNMTEALNASETGAVGDVPWSDIPKNATETYITGLLSHDENIYNPGTKNMRRAIMNSPEYQAVKRNIGVQDDDKVFRYMRKQIAEARKVAQQLDRENLHRLREGKTPFERQLRETRTDLDVLTPDRLSGDLSPREEEKGQEDRRGTGVQPKARAAAPKDGVDESPVEMPKVAMPVARRAGQVPPADEFEVADPAPSPVVFRAPVSKTKIQRRASGDLARQRRSSTRDKFLPLLPGLK